MAGKKNLDIVKLAIFAILVVSLILVVVGVCIAWVSSTSTVLGNSKTTTFVLSDLSDSENYGAMAAFAYITLALAAVCVLAFAASIFVKGNKIVNFVTLIAGVLLLVCAVVSIILSFTFCSNAGSLNLGGYVTSNLSPAAGAWLVGVFGIIGGVATAIGGLKK